MHHADTDYEPPLGNRSAGCCARRVSHAAVKGHTLASFAGQDLYVTHDDYGAAFFAYSCRGRLSGFGPLRNDSLAVVARAVLCIALRLHRCEKAQRGDRTHKGNMIGVYVGGILVAGLFTLTLGAICISLSLADRTPELCLYSTVSRIRQEDPRHVTTAL